MHQPRATIIIIIIIITRHGTTWARWMSLPIYGDLVASPGSMPLFRLLLKSLRQHICIHTLVGRSPLKVILMFWSFLVRSFRRFSCIRHDRASFKGPRCIHDTSLLQSTHQDLTDCAMMMDDEEPVWGGSVRQSCPRISSRHFCRKSFTSLA